LHAVSVAVALLLAGAAAADDWPTYLHDPARSSTSPETTLSPANAAQLTKLWSFKTGGGVAASPSVVGGVVYVGSWDGYEYALDAATGALKWKTFLGITTGASGCPFPQSAGVSSAASVQNGVVYVGGGDSYWYALSASTGAVLWRVQTGDNSAAGGMYNWASPLLYNGSAYIGVASMGDCPLVQGKLLRVDLATHAVLATFKAVPDGQIGGGIWTSPTVDAATNTIYVTTGTKTSSSQTLAEAIVALDATTLAVKGSWQVPLAAQVSDGDWGTTPTLIGGGLVVATNKNGVVYAFQRSNISAGPVWQQNVANGGACPTCGDGSVSSDAFDGTQLYVGGSKTSVGSIAYPGSISALDPLTGKAVWRQGQPDYVISALAAVNGLVLAGVGSNFTVLSASTGRTLFSYATGGPIYSAAAVSGGAIYLGSQDGSIYAFAPAVLPPPPGTIRVNAGGPAYVDSQSNSWSADCCNDGGMTYANAVPIAGTSDPALYQSQRWNTGPFTYTFSGLAAGSYQVTLKFAEIAYLGPGQRQFNVAINGTQVLTNFDIAAQVGFNTALDRTFNVTVGSAGQIAIAFTRGAADNPIVNAIQVGAAPGGSLSFTSGPQTLIAGQPSQAVQVGLTSPATSAVNVSLSSSSSTGVFATSPTGPWSPALQLSVAAGQAAPPPFYYQDTKAGSPVLTAASSGSTATQTETVNAAALSAITVSPTTASVIVGASKAFSAVGADAYGNPVSTSGAVWGTTVSGGSVQPVTGSSTTFTAGNLTAQGTVTAALGTAVGSATVTVTPVPAPTNLTASQKGKQRISLSWQGPSGLTFNVHRGSGPGAETLLAAGVRTTTYDDTRVVSRSTYYYYVVAVGPSGVLSAPSAEASATAK
jgi:outer membrane protein assembly factor BamB